MCWLGIHQVEVQPLTLPYIDFRARLLADPFFIQVFTAIDINIPWGGQPLVVNYQFALDIVFPQVEHPPEILGVIDNGHGVSIWT